MNFPRKITQVSPFIIALKRGLSETVRLRGIKQSYLAIAMKLDPSRICRWLDEDSPDFPDWDQYEQLVGLIGGLEPQRAFINWFGADLAGTAGGPDFDFSAETLGRMAGLLAKKDGSVLALLIQVIEDRKVGEDELAALVPEIQGLKVLVDDLFERARAAKHRTGGAA